MGWISIIIKQSLNKFSKIGEFQKGLADKFFLTTVNCLVKVLYLYDSRGGGERNSYVTVNLKIL